MSAEAVREAFASQADACRSLGSPFTARLCTLAGSRLDHETAVGRAILDWPGEPSSAGDSVPLRLAGALHALVITGASPELAAVYPPGHDAISNDDLWRAIRESLEVHEKGILEWLKSPPQTNEVRRSAALLPGFATITTLTGLPLVLSEVGASAGLNLFWDSYAIVLGERHFGPPASPVRIRPEWRGHIPAPLLPDGFSVRSRAGCDLRPLDPSNKSHQLRLLAYVWADQEDRKVRTLASIALAAARPERVDRADAVDWLRKRLGERHYSAAHVVYHSIAWQYLPASARKAGQALIEAAGEQATRDAPLAWLRMETDGDAPGAALTLTVWPTGESRALGRADFHGRWVDWRGWTP